MFLGIAILLGKSRPPVRMPRRIRHDMRQQDISEMSAVHMIWASTDSCDPSRFLCNQVDIRKSNFQECFYS